VTAKNPINRQEAENNLATKDPVLGRALRNFLRLTVWLARNYVGRAGTLFALSNFELDLLAFIERGVAGRLDLRMVDKQILAAVVRDYEAKSLT